MDGKPKLCVLYHKEQSIEILEIFVSMQSQFDIEVVSLADESFFAGYRLSLPIRLFTNFKNMPGYLKGIEAYIRDKDLIVSTSSTDLASYQVSKICEKLNISFFVFCNPIAGRESFFDEQQFRIQQEILQHAHKVICFEDYSRHILELSGLDFPRLMKLEPFSSLRETSDFELRRSKMRNYLKLSEAKKVASVLEAVDRKSIRFLLLSLFKAKQTLDLSNFQIIFTACEFDESLKHLSCELRLSEHILILDKLSHSLRRDLLFASDFVFSLRSDSEIETFDFWLCDALSLSYPVVQVGPNLIDWESMGAQIFEIPMAENIASFIKVISSLVSGSFNAPRSEGLFCVDEVANRFSECIIEHLKSETLTMSTCKEVELKLQNLLNLGSWDEFDGLMSAHLSDQALDVSSMVQLLCMQGKSFLARGNLEVAQKSFERALESDSESWMAFLGLAKIASLSHSDEEALMFYRKALANKVNLVEAYIGIGFIHRRKQMHEEAIFWLSQANLFDPTNKRVLLQLTQSCLEAEDSKAATKALLQLRGSLGDEPSLIMALGQLYLKQGNHEQGQALVSQALAMTNEDAA